jgi:hypothetical protein
MLKHVVAQTVMFAPTSYVDVAGLTANVNDGAVNTPHISGTNISSSIRLIVQQLIELPAGNPPTVIVVGEVR